MSLTSMTPDRAGVKMTLWDWVKFAGIGLWNLPALIASRPAVVDERLASVSSAITSREICVKFLSFLLVLRAFKREENI